MTVGFYSPLPPARSGVADYAAALLGALRRRGRVEVDAARCDAALYHLGNNPLHAAIYDRALSHPGVVVLHDAVLQHFLLGRLNEGAYVDEFVYNYGEWNRDLARELWRGRASSGSAGRYFDYPMLKRVAERSRAVVVHNPAAARAVRQHAPATPMVEIPHLFAPPALPDEAGRLRWRLAHGIPHGAYCFGVFGYLRESKRLPAVLEAFARLHRERPGTRLLVAGDIVSTDLERAIAPQLTGPGVVRVPYLEESTFWHAAAAVDACINLRFPAAGETSGIAVRLMGLGKPLVVTESLEVAGFPEGTLLRIPGGVGETDALWHHMVLLSSMAEVSCEIGRRARDYVTSRHGLETVADRYWETLCAHC